VLSVEMVTKGKTITYEAQVEQRGRKSEVVVGADGRPAKPSCDVDDRSSPWGTAAFSR
jgi:hypothetical protein